jgi:hypothetical protein
MASAEKRIEPVRVITLPVSFDTPKTPHTEYVTFDVVDMTYPYNTIFRRGLLNTFKAALHSAYLCLKIPATFGVRTVLGSYQEAKNIGKGFTPGNKNVHFFRATRAVQNSTPGRMQTGRVQKSYRDRRIIL